MELKQETKPYCLSCGMFLASEKVKEVHENAQPKPCLVVYRQRTTVTLTDNDKVLYKATLPNWINRLCVECSLLSFCFKDYRLLTKYQESKCSTFVYWQSLRTKSWLKSHKHNPCIKQIGNVKEIEGKNK